MCASAVRGRRCGGPNEFHVGYYQGRGVDPRASEIPCEGVVGRERVELQ